MLLKPASLGVLHTGGMAMSRKCHRRRGSRGSPLLPSFRHRRPVSWCHHTVCIVVISLLQRKPYGYLGPRRLLRTELGMEISMRTVQGASALRLTPGPALNTTARTVARWTGRLNIQRIGWPSTHAETDAGTCTWPRQSLRPYHT